ncbi:MAG: hypothetical protein ABIS67_12490 [Candidatus Eisenbacteria bacterium]
MSERRRILREVIYLAHEGGYDGPGSDWDTAPGPELDRVLEAGSHVAVLRSTQFSRPFFWHILFPDAVAVSSGNCAAPESDEDKEEIEAQIELLGEQLAKSDDPLKFLQKYLT